MSSHPKIRPQHLERQVYVYIRQSSLRQVKEHLESQDLQYQLVHRAQSLGWTEAQIVVIDDDLGQTAATSAQRQGFRSRPIHWQLTLGHLAARCKPPCNFWMNVKSFRHFSQSPQQAG